MKKAVLKERKKRTSWCPMEAQPLKSVDDLCKYPYIVMPKLDGVRAIIKDGLAITKHGNHLRNRHIKQLLENDLPKGFEFEGELMCYDVETGETLSFHEIMAITCSYYPKKEYFFKYHIWDVILHEPFDVRLKNIMRFKDEFPDWVEIVPFEIANNKEEVLAFNKKSKQKHPEGIVLRTHDAPYKYGRSAGSENWFIKWKEREESDGIVVGFTELMFNESDSEVNSIGYLQKAYKKAMLTHGDILGALYVKSPDFEKEYRVGTGYTLKQRIDFWKNKESILGKTVSVNHDGQNGHGSPKNVSFKGIRLD